MHVGRHQDEESPHAWSAQWIGPTEPLARGDWACFRLNFELDRPVLLPRLLVSCESKYWLWLNGQPAVFEGQVKRGPTPHDSYYDDVQLPFSLSEGPTSLCVLLWYWGKPGFSHNASGKAGLVLELFDGSRRLVETGRHWRSIRHPAYSAGDGPQPNYRLAESNLHYDARHEPEGWRSLDFDDTAWPNAHELGTPPAAPWGQLVRRPTPMLRDAGLFTYPSLPAMPFVTDGSPIVCPLPFNLQATPLFDIDAPAGLTVEMRTDNYNGGGANNVRGTYVTRAGRQQYESLGWMNGHDMRYHFPAGVTVHGLGYRQTRFDTPWLGAFECDDERLNTLWYKSCRTLDVCMRDTYMDCPDRERAQWWGDVVIQAGSAFYACDHDRSASLTRKAIQELVAWQRDDHTLFSPVPAGVPRPTHLAADLENGCWDKELPAQMLASIGWYGFWNYFQYSADLATLKAVYPSVKRFLSIWTFDDARGLVDHRAGGWDWVDWGANVDADVSINAWYALALRGQLHMARTLGEEADVVSARARLKQMHEGFNRAFWKGSHYQADASLPQPDDRAQAMAVVAGFVDRLKAPKVADVLMQQRHAGPYMEKYIIEALFQLGEHESGLKRMLERFAEQIDSPITTLWEGWSVRDATWGGGTYNHAWSGWPITLLQQYVAGITPITAGFERIAVRPRPAQLRQLRSTVPSRPGLIELTLDVDANLLSLEIPAGCTAEVSTPAQGQFTVGSGRHSLKWSDTDVLSPASR
jgi:alpha-L-rhamnosidase